MDKREMKTTIFKANGERLTFNCLEVDSIDQLKPGQQLCFAQDEDAVRIFEGEWTEVSDYLRHTTGLEGIRIRVAQISFL